jgi:drug/metabolite transporter (DMT)-like permease
MSGAADPSDQPVAPWFAPLAARPRLSALIGALWIAFSGIFYRFSSASPSTATVFRCGYAVLFLLPLTWGEHRRYGPLGRDTIRLALLAGIFFAADLTFWHHSIEYVGAGLATVLGNLQVVVVAVVAWFVIGERPTPGTVLAIPVMLVGVVLIAGVAGGDAYGRDPLLGVILGILTALSYAGYLIFMRRANRDLRRPAGPLMLASASAAGAGLVVGGLLGDLDLVPSLPMHAWLVILALTSQVIGYLFINVSLPRLPSVITSLILLTQPVATVILSMILLGETPSPGQLLGVVFVVVGLVVANASRARTVGEQKALETMTGP